MAHNGSTDQGQEPGGATNGQGQEPQGQENPPTGGQEPQGNQDPSQGNPFDPSTISDPALRAYVEKVAKDAQEARQEAARYRTERNTYQGQVQQFQQQNETDQERANREAQETQQRLEKLAQENRDLKVGAAVRQAADKAKAFNPTTVYGLIGSKVETDDQGNPTNVDELLKDLRQSDPYLFKRATADAGQGAGEQGAPALNMNDAIRAAAGRGQR